jgi:hypothetical protein
MTRITGALTIAALLLVSIIAGTLPVKWALANPLPAMQEKIEITSPKNATYNINKIFLAINVTTTYSCTLFYSVDGHSMKPVENMTVISRENINVGKNPPVYKLVLNASAWVSVPLGEHNITVYHINPKTELKVGQAVAIFYIDSLSPNIPEFPSWIILPLLLLGILVVTMYRKKLTKI